MVPMLSIDSLHDVLGRWAPSLTVPLAQLQTAIASMAGVGFSFTALTLVFGVFYFLEKELNSYVSSTDYTRFLRTLERTGVEIDKFAGISRLGRRTRLVSLLWAINMALAGLAIALLPAESVDRPSWFVIVQLFGLVAATVSTVWLGWRRFTVGEDIRNVMRSIDRLRRLDEDAKEARQHADRAAFYAELGEKALVTTDRVHRRLGAAEKELIEQSVSRAVEELRQREAVSAER